MKCCSRSTFGVVIGGLNMIGYIGLTTFLITVSMENATTKSKTKEQQLETAFRTTISVLLTIVYLVMALASGLLITGIVKRRHQWMKPWLVLSGIGIIINCVSVAGGFIGFLIGGDTISTAFTILFVGVIILGISALIVWAIYTLYRDIREENTKKPINGSMGDNGIPYQLQNNY